MIDLDYSLVIEATDEPDCFGFYSPDLEGFSGIGHFVEDCLYKARWGMAEHVFTNPTSSLTRAFFSTRNIIMICPLTRPA